MKSFFYIVTLNIIVIGLVSCKYQCPGYDLDDKSSISFRLDDSVVYVSNKNDTLIFVVSDFFAEGPNSWRGLAMDIDCSPKCYYKMTALSNSQMTINETETWKMDISFCDDKPYDNVIFIRSNVVNKDFDYEIIGNYQTDTITFYGVIKVNDLSGQRRIDNFMKAVNHGIIDFHDKRTDLIWTQIIK